MKWLKWCGIVVGVILLILAVVPFFISLNDYIPQIEKEISARIEEPVKIGSLRAAGLPLPHLTVTGITVGKTEDISARPPRRSSARTLRRAARPASTSSRGIWRWTAARAA